MEQTRKSLPGPSLGWVSASARAPAAYAAESPTCGTCHSLASGASADAWTLPLGTKQQRLAQGMTASASSEVYTTAHSSLGMLPVHTPWWAQSPVTHITLRGLETPGFATGLQAPPPPETPPALARGAGSHRIHCLGLVQRGGQGTWRTRMVHVCLSAVRSPDHLYTEATDGFNTPRLTGGPVLGQLQSFLFHFPRPSARRDAL